MQMARIAQSPPIGCLVLKHDQTIWGKPRKHQNLLVVLPSKFVMQIFVSAILAQPNRYICFRNTASVSSANWKISFNRSSFHEPLHKCTLQEDKKEMIEKKKKKKKRKEKFEYNKTLWEYYGMNGRGRGGGGEGLKV